MLKGNSYKGEKQGECNEVALRLKNVSIVLKSEFLESPHSFKTLLL